MRTALAFLTRIPVATGAPLTARSLSRAAIWFPVVGVLVGGVMAGARAVAHGPLDPTTSTVLAVLVAIVVTGGFHEDGLADCADAIGAHVGRERRLEILHDPRVGTYGALALVFAVLFPVAVLAPLDDEAFLRAAVTAHVLGRWSSVVLAFALRPARTTGAGVLLSTGPATTAAATAIAAVLALTVAGPEPGALALAVAATVTAAGGALARRAFGGVTGDAFGAVNKLVELATYAALAAA